jgi:putative hydrolase of the HAD superfamily
LIYEQTLATLGVRAEDAIFVGDSWRPDVLGPISVGMTSVHVCRDPTKDLPELIDGARRIGGLEQLLSLEQFSART